MKSNYKIKKFPLIILLIFLFSSQFSFAQKFRFIVWGDSQFENPKIFEEIVKETELLHPAFVIHVGDMIHGYTYDINTARKQWKEFKKQISPLTVPFYPTPGNHDVTTKEIQPAYLEAWGKDKLYYSFNYENSHFIIINAFLDQQFNTIPQVEMKWLKEDLEKNKNADNIFISFHSPLYMNSQYNWKRVAKLLKNYHIKGVFSGHYHIYDYRVENEIPYFCINSSGNMNFTNFLAGYGHGFLYVTVNGSKVNYAFIDNGKVYPPDAVKPGQSGRSPKFFNTDKSIIIPDPSIAPVNITAEVPVKNRSNIIRNYTLTWETKDYRWKFKPWGANVTVNPGETKTIKFSISGPQGNFTRDDLPKLKISAPYKTLAGVITHSVYYFHLFNPSRTIAKYTKDKITLDGIPDEKAWQKVKGIENLYYGYTGKPDKEKTSVKVLYDNSNLYVGIIGQEPHPEKLSAKAYGDIPLVFGDDDFELFFDTNRDQTTFYRLMVNSKSTILCSSPKGLFTFKFVVNTHIGKDYWSAEFKIPFSQLNTSKPAKGEIWGFNVIRHRLQSKIQQSFWSMMQYYPPYQPEYFGQLKFE